MNAPHLLFLLTVGLAALLAAPQTWSIGLLPAYEAALVNDPAYRGALRDNEAGQQYRVLGRASLLPVVAASYGRLRVPESLKSSAHS